MPWVECRLFVLGKEIVRVAIEHHFADQLHRNQLLGNKLGRIQQIEIEFEFVLFRDQLKPKLVFRVISRFDGFPQFTAVEIRITPGQLLGFIPHQRGFTRNRLPVKAHKGGFTFGVNQAEGVNTKSFHRA